MAVPWRAADQQGSRSALARACAGEVRAAAQCNTVEVRKNLPDAVRELGAVPKLVWLYIDAYPGRYSVRDLYARLGVHPGRALPALVAAGLLIEEEAPKGHDGGKYRAALPGKDTK